MAMMLPAVRGAWRGAVRATARVLAWVVLGALYWPIFLPARLLLALGRRDPLRRAFPAPGESCWDVWTAPRWAQPRRRQF